MRAAPAARSVPSLTAQLHVAPAWSELRITGFGAERIIPREQSRRLAELLDRLLASSAPATRPWTAGDRALPTVELRSADGILGRLEIDTGQARWLPARGAPRVIEPDPALLDALRGELAR